MAVFYSFHYDRDVHRVQLIEQMGALEGQPILNNQEWEAVKSGGDNAIKEWISDKMKWKSAVIVLVGKETASREWVHYEIQKAWDDKKPLLGIRIHGLSSMGSVDSSGPTPLTESQAYQEFRSLIRHRPTGQGRSIPKPPTTT